MDANARLAHVENAPDQSTTYFCSDGCVVVRDDLREVFKGGFLIGSFRDDEPGMRNVLLVTLSQERRVRKGKLADAFGVHPETLRRVRRRFEKGGLSSIVEDNPGGPKRVRTKKLVDNLVGLFEQGATIDATHTAVKGKASRSVVGVVHKEWKEAQRAVSRGGAVQVEAQAEEPCQLALGGDVPIEEASESDEDAQDEEEVEPEGELEEPEEKETGAETAASGARREMPLETAVARGGRRVQHLGSWVMLAMVEALGLYRYAEKLRAEAADDVLCQGERWVSAVALRVALDATAIALTLGQGCVEGVRRLATPSVATLLRNRGAVSESWVRKVLRRFSERRGELLHLVQSFSLVRETYEDAEERAVFYVDNHMRPYTGKHKIRKGWRMQAKRALPGVSDYWVHDQDGRPLLRIDDPTHQSLTHWLTPIAELLCDALGRDEGVTPLLVFDRAGAFPEEMAELRDRRFEFVTYERSPYPLFTASELTETLELGEETIHFGEVRHKNLGKGRGRVRRIAFRTEEGEQVSVLAVSEAPAEELLCCLLARWARQENQFKHGVERWGINQIDSYKVEPYDPEAVIPNPARRRLDRALRVSRAAEGDALRKLAHLSKDHPSRAKLAERAREARAQQEALEAQRPSVPTHAPVKETELAGKLVRHPRRYKMLLDTVRIALANAESELASRLGPHLPKAAEAKKTLANLFAAPGEVRLSKNSVQLVLEPAGTDREMEAFNELFSELNALDLTLPGDPSRRKLRFQLHMH
jgi:hypothetical protein